MRRRLRDGGCRAGGWAVVILVPLVLGGCAAGASSSAPSPSPSSQAQRLLEQVVLPAGSEPLSPADVGPVPLQSSDVGCGGLVEQVEYWRVGGTSVDALQRWLERHVPKDLEVTGTGSGGDRAGETMTEVDLGVRSQDLAPAGSRVVLTAVREGSRTVVRASAQVVPARGCTSTHRYGPATTVRSGASRN